VKVVGSGLSDVVVVPFEIGGRFVDVDGSGKWIVD
jgi:hypothetical protein